MMSAVRIRTAVTSITNSALCDAHAGLYMPIKHGGPGIRRVSSLAAPAFLASAASTLVLQEQILAQFLYPQTHFLNHISHLGPIQLGHLRIRCGIVVSMPWCPVFER